MNLEFSWLEGNRPILVPPDNRIDRYIECILECYPENDATTVSDNLRPNARLKQHIGEILDWIYDKQGNSYTVTWHQE